VALRVRVGVAGGERGGSVTPSTFLDGRVSLYGGDCLATIKTLADNSIDAVVTDPPYALVSISKRLKKANSEDVEANFVARKIDGQSTSPYQSMARGFMGKSWDNGATAFAVEFWAEVLRVLKPGGHVAAFGGTRTYHRLACAIEDAGFEIRDQLAWCFGTGFPKSHDVSKGIDKAARAAGAAVGVNEDWLRRKPNGSAGVNSVGLSATMDYNLYAPATDAAREWEGWGTALKPAWEPICLARKPLSEGTVAANVLRWGTGAININGCRIGDFDPAAGRWPANIVHDGSPEVLAAFPDSAGQLFATGPQYGNRSSVNVYGDYGPIADHQPRGDSGSAARFFFSAKADADDRLGSKHPTVKPVDLMRWLCRLITPPGGVVLDPFAGSGTTGEAAWREGFVAVLCEREEEYQADIARRMRLAQAGPAERRREGAKARNAGKTEAHGPLFSDGAA
jgi:site-specific DNA-methyltransferase (adenine-specific)